jgi:hypothetical protein
MPTAKAITTHKSVKSVPVEASKSVGVEVGKVTIESIVQKKLF